MKKIEGSWKSEVRRFISLITDSLLLITGFWFLITLFCLSLAGSASAVFKSGIPASSKIKAVYLRGKSPDVLKNSEFYNWAASSMSFNGNFWRTQVNLTPGNTFYYKYCLEYETASGTVTIWEQSQKYHTIYVTYNNTAFLDGDFENEIPVTSIFDNWAGAPLPPDGISVEVSSGRAKISWTVPHFGGRDILDLNGFLIYLSTTDGKNWTNCNDTNALIRSSETSAEFVNLTNNVTYWLKMRSVDKYEYGTVDINSDYYPDAVFNRRFPWFYSPSLPFRPDRIVLCKFSLLYPGNEKVYLEIGGEEIRMKREGDRYACWRTLVEKETYEYSYKTQNLSDPAGLRSVKIRDIDGDGKFYAEDVWGVETVRGIPDSIIGWKIVSSSASIDFLWKKNPVYNGKISVFYSENLSNWFVLVSTSAENFSWQGFTAGKKYYFAIGDFSSQSVPFEIEAGSSCLVKVPSSFSISGLIDQNLTASDYKSALKVVCSVPQEKSGKFASSYLVIYSSYNISISTGDALDWEDLDFLIKNKGVPPGGEIKFYSDLPASAGEMKAYYIRNLSVFGSYSNVFCSLPDVFVTPAEISRKTGGVFSRDKMSVAFAKYSLPVKRAYLTVYKWPEIEISRKFETLKNKIENANARSSQISYQSFISTETIFLINLKKTNGAPVGKNFKSEVKATIPYPASASAETLAPFYLDEENGFWALAKISPEFVPPVINSSSRTATFPVSHFSVYCLMKTQGEKDLSSAAVYPNPYKPYDGKWETGHSDGDAWSGIHFTRLTSQTKIKIYTIDGIPVRSRLNSTGNGECYWDAKNDDGRFVASGLYIYVAEDPNALGVKKVVGKIAIVR
ncbi:MAG: fibronectin type III domain-containing protein [Elusimicrobia bacterium]|nr:fibronectin type III domain-containing protein [Elusimicrobiota bacterium]